MGFYPNVSQTKNTVPTSGNPWEREEREKEHEARREHARHWRDQQIVELSLQNQRTQQQDEQLKTLVLERDFERRALEEEQEEESESQYNKNNVQEVLRLVQPAAVPPTVQTTRVKQVEIKMTNISPNSDHGSTSSNEQIPINQSNVPPVQPKSILKHNAFTPSSPSKHGKTTSFAPPKTGGPNLSEITMNNTNANTLMTQMTKDMDQMNVSNNNNHILDFNQPISIKTQDHDFANNNYHDQVTMPPPPPERNSSYAVMQQQKSRPSGKLTFNDQMSNNSMDAYTNNSPMLLSPVNNAQAGNNGILLQQQMNMMNNSINNSSFNRDSRRVSFHDHENNNVMGDQAELSIIREDPNVRFKILSVSSF